MAEVPKQDPKIDKAAAKALRQKRVLQRMVVTMLESSIHDARGLKAAEVDQLVEAMSVLGWLPPELFKGAVFNLGVIDEQPIE